MAPLSCGSVFSWFSSVHNSRWRVRMCVCVCGGEGVEVGEWRFPSWHLIWKYLVHVQNNLKVGEAIYELLKSIIHQKNPILLPFLGMSWRCDLFRNTAFFSFAAVFFVKLHYFRNGSGCGYHFRSGCLYLIIIYPINKRAALNAGFFWEGGGRGCHR